MTAARRSLSAMRPVTRGATAVAVALAVVLLASPSAEADNTEVAKEEFQRGTVAYKLGKFEEALSAYERAYAAKPLAAILFNIGQCHYQLKHYERALFFYRGYLLETPDAKNREFVETQIANTERVLAKESEAEREQRRAEEERLVLQARVLELQIRHEEARAEAAAPSTAPPAAHAQTLSPEATAAVEARAKPPAAVDESEGGMDTGLWVAVGAGIAVAATVTLGLAATAGGGVYLLWPAPTVDPERSLGKVDYRQ